MTVDLVIKGGTVVDGTGAPARQADVAIHDGRIVGIGDVDDSGDAHDRRGRPRRRARVRRPPHALRRAAAVGSDREPVADATASPRCSAATAASRSRRAATSTSTTSRGSWRASRASRSRRCKQGVPWDWRTFGEYLDRVERGGIAVNAGFLVRSLGAAAQCDGGARGRRGGDRRRDRRRWHGCCTTRSTRARWASRRRRRRRTTTATAIRCRHACRDARRDAARWPASLNAHAGTQLELIIPGCLNGFTDDEVDLMTEMSLAAERPLNWNVLGVAQGGMHEHQLDAGTPRGCAGRAGSSHSRCRRACGSGCSSSPDSCSTASRAGGRRSRLPIDERMRALIDPEVRGPPRRAGALARGGGAGGSRPLGAPRGRRGVHARDRKHEGKKIGDIAREQGKAAVRRAARHRDRRRPAHGSASRLRRPGARRRVEDARRSVARPARDRSAAPTPARTST